MTKARPNAPCPCGSGQKLKRCCRPYHLGAKLPETPEALMRSRYCAYALGLVDYVLDTTDPAGERSEVDRAAWAASVRRFSEETEFLGLEVLEAESEGDAGVVAFRVELRQGEADASFGERSTFRRVQGRWLYVTGTTS